jgi:hypothetical protein
MIWNIIMLAIGWPVACDSFVCEDGMTDGMVLTHEIIDTIPTHSSEYHLIKANVLDT